MEEDIILCSKDVLNAYNLGSIEMIKKSAEALENLVIKYSGSFTNVKYPLLVFTALYRVISLGHCNKIDVILTAYYCMLKSYKEKENIEKVETAMYGFLFIDSNMPLLQLLLLKRIKNVSDAQSILLHQLALFYSTMESYTYHIELDYSTSLLLKNRKKIYSDILNINLDLIPIDRLNAFANWFCNNVEFELLANELKKFSNFKDPTF